MLKLLKRFWEWLDKLSAYDVYDEAFKRLQAEKKVHGMSVEYWRIWCEEVCPAYRKEIESTPESPRDPLTAKVLHDMDKPVGQRKYF